MANEVGLSDITCLSDEVGIIGTSNFPGPLEFLWFGPQGAVSANNALATISQPGNFTLVIEYEDGLCTAEQEFTVEVDTVSFTGVFPETGYLTCDESTFPLWPNPCPMPPLPCRGAQQAAPSRAVAPP